MEVFFCYVWYGFSSVGYWVWFDFPRFKRDKTQVEKVLNYKRFQIGNHREKPENNGLLSLQKGETRRDISL